MDDAAIGDDELDELDEHVDGRRARRARNRAAVVDAMLAFYRDGDFAPSTADIAARAGISARSLFRYFDDLDDLVRAAISAQHAHVQQFVPLDLDRDAPFDERLPAFVEHRLRLLEAMDGPGRVARLREPFEPLIAAELDQARTLLRRQVRSVFAPELAVLGGDAAEAALAAADVVTSFEGYQLLRLDQGLDRDAAARVMITGLTALLAPDDG